MRFEAWDARLSWPRNAVPWLAATTLLNSAGRLVYPVAVSLFAAEEGALALLLLLSSFAFALGRALVIDRAVRHLRAQLFDDLARAIDRFPALPGPGSAAIEQLETQVARGLPWMEARLAYTLPGIMGNLLAVPVIAALALKEIGVLGTSLAGLAALLVVAVVTWSARYSAAWSDRAWDEYQSIASLIERGLRARVELRAHGLSGAQHDKLAQRAETWSRLDSNARLLFAATGMAVPMSVLGAGILLGELAGLHSLDWLLAVARTPHGAGLATGLFLLAGLPVLLGFARNCADYHAERPHVQAFSSFCAAGDSCVEVVVNEGPLGAVRFEACVFEYPSDLSSGSGTRIEVDFSWPLGESLCLMGPNGCGKTTIALALLGELSARSGACFVEIAGRRYPPVALRGSCGYLSQDAFFDENETVMEAIRFVAPAADEHAMLGLLRQLWAEPYDVALLQRKAGSLSSGERRLIALARVLLRRAELTILDEPEANLGLGARERVARVLAEFCAQQRVLILTHDASLAQLAQRTLVFDATRTVRQMHEAE